MTPPGGHPGQHAYTIVIHILSTSLASVLIFLSAVTLGICLVARDVRIFDREKSLGQNNFGYNRSHGRNLSSASGQGEFIAQHFFNKMDHWSFYVQSYMLVLKHEWSLYLGHLCVNTCSPHTLKKEEFTVSTVCENGYM